MKQIKWVLTLINQISVERSDREERRTDQSIEGDEVKVMDPMKWDDEDPQKVYEEMIACIYH